MPLPTFEVGVVRADVTRRGKRFEPGARGRTIRAILDEVVRDATKLARRVVDEEINDAVQTYTEHKCNTIRFKPATLARILPRLSPGAGIRASA